MLIDQSHRKWFVGSVAVLAVATAAYIPYSLRSPQGVRGGSTLGLVYGSMGFACMLFAGLLGLRKRFPVWRVGRAQTWMRGHLWLGLVSFPLILLHGGIHFGGSLTRVLMWLFILVFASGILGAALQHFMPRVQTTQLPMETIYEQIDRVRGQLAEEAGRLVEESCAALEGEVSSATERQRAAAAGAGANWDVTVASGMQVDEQASTELRRFLASEVQPYLDKAGPRGTRLGAPAVAAAMFRQLRVLLPPTLHSNIDDLENVCEEKRQLDKQSRLHKILHGWLLVHVPLSYALLLLGAWHAIVAVRF
ncbi:MAG: ferric reductase-like transmembrane domain-containing protein [Terriglobales bacterium]